MNDGRRNRGRQHTRKVQCTTHGEVEASTSTSTLITVVVGFFLKRKKTERKKERKNERGEGRKRSARLVRTAFQRAQDYHVLALLPVLHHLRRLHRPTTAMEGARNRAVITLLLVGFQIPSVYSHLWIVVTWAT